MRVLPLLPDHADPGAWPFGDVELVWTGGLQRTWPLRVRTGTAVHALHFPPQRWDEALLDGAARALGARLGADFLVLAAGLPRGRWETSRFMRILEGLLEATHSRGVKVALRPAAGEAGALAALLKEVRGEAVGFCWDSGVGSDLEAISDRLFCAVGREGENLGALQRTGYRWNLAVAAASPAAFEAVKARLLAAHPPVLFPAELPAQVLGRPLLPDEGIRFGRAWGPR